VIARFFCAAIALAALSCAVATPIPGHRGAVVHQYRLRVKDSAGRPISDAAATIKRYRGAEFATDTVISSDANGELSVSILSAPDTSVAYSNHYESKIDYVVRKDGFLPVTGSLRNVYELANLDPRSESDLAKQTAEVTIDRPEDLLDDSFNSSDAAPFRNGVIAFIDSFAVNRYAENMVLRQKSIHLTVESGRVALSFKFDCVTGFNSDVLKPADIARILLADDVVKFLPLLKRQTDYTKFAEYEFSFRCGIRSFDDAGSSFDYSDFTFRTPASILNEFIDERTFYPHLIESTTVTSDGKPLEIVH